MGERVSIRPDAEPDASPVLEYGRGSRFGGWWRSFQAGVHERFDGASVFAGQLIGLVGGGRRVAFACGLACLTGGLGACLSRGPEVAGPFWMTVGGFILGLCLPLPKRDD